MLLIGANEYLSLLLTSRRTLKFKICWSFHLRYGDIRFPVPAKWMLSLIWNREKNRILHDDFLVSKHQPHSQGLSTSFPLSLQSKDEEGPWAWGCRNICLCVMKSSIHSMMLKFKTIKFENSFFHLEINCYFWLTSRPGGPGSPGDPVSEKGGF